MQAFSEQAILFQEKILERSGLGEESYFSDGTLRLHSTAAAPVPELAPTPAVAAGIMRLQTELTDATHQECLDESNMVLFDCVANLLEKTGTQPHEVRLHLPLLPATALLPACCTSHSAA